MKLLKILMHNAHLKTTGAASASPDPPPPTPLTQLLDMKMVYLTQLLDMKMEEICSQK